jgi:Rhs element Vgr protein
MTDERIVPTPAPTDLPTFRILTDGKEISREYHVISISVARAINKIPTAQIIVLDGDVASEDFEHSNSQDFVPGKDIEILAGYHSDDTTIYKGIVTSHGIKVRKTKPSLLVVDCKHPAVKMAVGRKNAYYYDMTDSDIIEEIVADYKLQAEVETTEVRHKEMVKCYTTDWDFMVARAEVNGKLVVVRDDSIAVKAPDTGQTPVLSLIHGSTMMEFEATMDARSQLAGTQCSSWDYSTQEILQEQSDSARFAEHGNIDASDLADVIGLDSLQMCHTGQVVDEELKAWAQARLLRSRLAKIVGRAKCQGFAEIEPGNMVELKGVGDRFNGNAFVSAVRQHICPQNWETDIQFGFSSEWFSERQPNILDRPAAGLLPAVRGLQVGVVTALQDDPDGEHRVRVRVPVVDPEDKGIWGRVASPDAGEDRGIFFRPEINDEVVVGFLNDDPRDPVILGMFNSSAKPAPITASDDNHEKGLVTRSKMRMIFNDDKISLTIETPNGNVMTFSDDEGSIVLQDENDNRISMDSSGISIESTGDINIKASGDVNVESTNTSVSASAQFKAEGSAGAEVSTSATAVVKGSLVQIN